MDAEVSVPQVWVLVEQVEGLPEDLLKTAPSPEGLLCWDSPAEATVADVPTPSIIGWGATLRWEFSGTYAMRDAARRWDLLTQNAQVIMGDSVSTAPTAAAPVALGSFGFAASTPGYLVVPSVAVLRENGNTYILSSSLDGPPAPIDLPEAAPLQKPVGIWTTPGRMTQNQWQLAVRRLIGLLRAGAASKVVMARDMSVSAATPIDERFLASRLRELYPTTYVYAVEGLIGATPEILASMQDGAVTSRVLAGTSAPGGGRELLDSMKNRSEHHFAVESVARALAPLSEKLHVPSNPSLLELPNVSHLATDITASIPGGNILDVVAALHPTAAVCGTPTKLAFNILEEIEGTQRGRYSGPVGWIDASGSGEFGIALRCGQLSKDREQITVFAGGGIMPDSIPELELAETRAKMKPVLEALGVEN